MSALQFTPFTSTVLPEFWSAFTKIKIDQLKLSEQPVSIRGNYTAGKSILDRETGKQLSLGTSITFNDESLTDSPVASTS